MEKQAAYNLGARLALQEADVAEEYYPHTKEAAYELGTRLAFHAAGILPKEEKPAEKVAEEKKPDVKALLARIKQ